MVTRKTTDEIRRLLNNAKLDFESVENKALNDYLPKIFQTCPFSDELCATRQCLECVVFIKYASKRNSKAKAQNSSKSFRQH
jgi:hypothetical protein